MSDIVHNDLRILGPSYDAQYPPPLLRTEQRRRSNLLRCYERTFDRINVLGVHPSPGHTGCVNALSWARDGELLLSGGDDTTVRIWSMDAADTFQDYPFVCRSVIHTDHRANIFSAQMLPYSTRIATAAGDKQVRIFDVREEGLSGSLNGSETSYTAGQACIRVLKCHDQRVKRIVTEDSPDLFLSVGEDGAVRQHDLRMRPHDCLDESCPSPLVKVNHELSTLSLSPLTPYQFVVAGDSPYGYLFDRRQIGRILREEWGENLQREARDSLTNCVRRFGRPKDGSRERGRESDHITGSRMSAFNGHEVIFTFSADAVYLYSTLDDTVNDDSMSTRSRSPLIPKQNSEITKSSLTVRIQDDRMNLDDEFISDSPVEINSAHPSEERGGRIVLDHEDEDEDEDEDEEDDGELDTFSAGNEEDFQPGVPVIHPQRRFTGARNVQTVKDVNFLGPSDEFVTSGSDDGNFFIWRKSTGAIHGIYEGDGSIVNMVESHPYLPLIATSGIDTTVKLFAPVIGTSKFSKMTSATQIVEANDRMNRTPILRFSFPLATLLAQTRLGRDGGGDIECRSQ